MPNKYSWLWTLGGILVVAALAIFALAIFNAKPATAPDATQGQFCGGIAGKQCPPGYLCKYSGKYPDAGGTCVDKL